MLFRSVGNGSRIDAIARGKPLHGLCRLLVGRAEHAAGRLVDGAHDVAAHLLYGLVVDLVNDVAKAPIECLGKQLRDQRASVACQEAGNGAGNHLAQVFQREAGIEDADRILTWA